MATAKKTTKVATTPPKKTIKAKVETTPLKRKEVATTPQQFSMPQEVKDWIERANSIMNHQKGEIARLKEENAQLKAYRRFAEHRILRSEAE